MSYQNIQKELLEKRIEDTKKLLSEPELSEMAKEELAKLLKEKEALEQTDLTKPRGVIVEIRAAAGGEEAGLFAADLYRMYARFAQNKGWKVKEISRNEGGLDNLKEVVFEMDGDKALESLRFESGVHRVQRVPLTESSGRIHTSTATVAVLPKIEESDFHINEKDLKIETFRASGHGGQNVQKVETAVRIIHLPTGISATCQSERSQYQNRQLSQDVLRSRLYQHQQQEKSKSIDNTRKSQIGTGDRSEKIRTYNFLQDRITDHRIKKSWHKIQNILEGNLDPIIKIFDEIN